MEKPESLEEKKGREKILELLHEIDFRDEMIENLKKRLSFYENNVISLKEWVW